MTNQAQRQYNLEQAAVGMREATKLWNRAFQGEWDRIDEAMLYAADVHGISDMLRDLWIKNNFRVDLAVSQLFWKFRRGSERTQRGNYGSRLLIVYAKRYQALARALGEPLDSVAGDRSDDSFTDLCDALPILGEWTFGYLLEHVNSANLDSLVKDQWPELASRVLRGENYFALHLRDAAKDEMLHLLCEDKP